jgi:ribokinase
MVASLPGQPTGVALILVDSTGENEIAVVPGANGAIEKGYVSECLSRLGRLTGDVVLVCNEVPLDVVREALVCAHASGGTTILNPAPALGLDRSVLALADIITPNRNELLTLLHTEARRTGRRTDTNQEAASRARQLLETGPDGPGVRKAVIVTLGAAGVLVIERVGSGLEGSAAGAALSAGTAAARAADAVALETPPAEVAQATEPCDGTTDSTEPGGGDQTDRETIATRPTPQLEGDLRIWELPGERVATVDSTGAGDAFVGALAAAIAEGRSLAEAVRRAVAAGALATTHNGAREGMPTALELEEFLATTR